MNIITISRGSLSGAKILSERLSEKLHIPVISREQVIEEAEEQYSIKDSGIADMSWVDRPPSIIERQSFKSKHYILAFQTILLEKAMLGSMIYLGHFGQFMFDGLSFLLRVRLLRPHKIRIDYLKQTYHIDDEQAEIELKLIDERRRKWSELLYGINVEDAIHYDLVLNYEKMSIDSAVKIISTAVTLPEYNSTAKSEMFMRDLYLSSKAKLLLFLSPLTRGYDVDVAASSEYGSLKIKMLDNYNEVELDKFESHLKYELGNIEGIKEVSFI
jgi:cytidylate kinase